MPQEQDFKNFAIVMAVVCIPFFFLIGSLNTTSGMTFWRNKWHNLLDWVSRKLQHPEAEDDQRTCEGIQTRTNVITSSNKVPDRPRPRERSYSTSRSMALRREQLRTATTPISPRITSSRRATSLRSGAAPAANLGPINAVTVSDSNDSRKEAGGGTAAEKGVETNPGGRSWREIMFGRRKSARDHHV